MGVLSGLSALRAAIASKDGAAAKVAAAAMPVLVAKPQTPSEWYQEQVRNNPTLRIPVGITPPPGMCPPGAIVNQMGCTDGRSPVADAIKAVAPVLLTAAIPAAGIATKLVTSVAPSPVSTAIARAQQLVQIASSPPAPAVAIARAIAPTLTPVSRSEPVASLVTNAAKTVAQVALASSGSNMVTSGTPSPLTTAARAASTVGGLGAAIQGVVSGIQRLVPGGATGTSVGTTCPPGTIRGPLGTCIDLIPGGSTSGGGMVIGRFDPIMGAYGAGLLPGRESRTVHFCPPGLVLGKDNVCYAKGQLGKKNRKHNPGFRPPITGGDVSAIRRAEAARKRVMTLGRGVGLYVSKKRPECGPKKKR